MPAYLVMQITITDEEKWGNYRDAVMPLLARFGAKRMTKGDGLQLLEGRDDERRIVMFEFASMDAIHAFWDSPEYRLVKELRRDAATLEAWATAGV